MGARGGGAGGGSGQRQGGRKVEEREEGGEQGVGASVVETGAGAFEAERPLVQDVGGAAAKGAAENLVAVGGQQVGGNGSQEALAGRSDVCRDGLARTERHRLGRGRRNEPKRQGERGGKSRRDGVVEREVEGGGRGREQSTGGDEGEGEVDVVDDDAAAGGASRATTTQVRGEGLEDVGVALGVAEGGGRHGGGRPAVEAQTGGGRGGIEERLVQGHLAGKA